MFIGVLCWALDVAFEPTPFAKKAITTTSSKMMMPAMRNGSFSPIPDLFAPRLLGAAYTLIECSSGSAERLDWRGM